MPYKRNYKRRYYKRRNRSRYAVSTLAKRVNKLTRYVQPEFNFISVTINNTPDGSTGNFDALNNLAQGDNVGYRNGNQVRFLSIQMNCSAKLHASATNTRVRYILFVDKQPLVGTPSATDVLDGGAAMIAMRNLGNRNRFQILLDRVVQIDSDDPEYIFRYYKRKMINTTWQTSANTSQEKNKIYLFMFSDQATYTPTVAVEARLRYIDN